MLSDFDKRKAKDLPFTQQSLYQDLLKNFQQAEWGECNRLLGLLLEEYPDHPYLLDFQKEIEVRHTLFNLGEQAEEEKRLGQKKQTLSRIGLGILATAAVVLIIFGSYQLYRNRVEASRLARQQELQAQTLATKYENASDYLRTGRPEEALMLYVEIQEIDPAYLDITEKVETTQALVEIETLYQEGNQYYQAGEVNQALNALQQVEELSPEYKDTRLLITNIQQEQQIQQLLANALDAFDDADWQAVVDNFERIRTIDSSFNQPELKDKLFISYMNLIIDVADRPDASVEDVAKAETYYRSALALFPQSQEYANEREQLQKTAINLIANKYFIYAQELLETEKYSLPAMEQAIKVLNKANAIGSGNPAIESEIMNAQLYLNSFTFFVNNNWDRAIEGFEDLYKSDENFADGMVKYLLFESYMALGDALLAYADFPSARDNYEKAEIYAFGEESATLWLFEAEVRMGIILKRLGLPQESAAYFVYASQLVDLPNHITTAGQDTQNLYYQALGAYQRNDFWNASRMYEELFSNIAFIYSYQTISAFRGDTLAYLAFTYGSTIDAIRLANDLGASTSIRTDQELVVPFVETNEN